jgi:hypothetical protein
MVREVCFATFLCNDIVSLKKEMDDNDVDSIIPILVHRRDISAQEASDIAVRMMEQAYLSFSDAAGRLRAVVSADDDSMLKEHVGVFVDGCMDVMVGNVVFSMHAPRYSGLEFLDAEGYRFRVVL